MTMIKAGTTTTEWWSIIGFIGIGLFLVVLKRYVPEIGIDDTIIQSYWFGGGFTTGLYSISRGMVKARDTIIKSEWSDLSRPLLVADPPKPDPNKLKAESVLRLAIAEYEKYGDTADFIKKNEE